MTQNKYTYKKKVSRRNPADQWPISWKIDSVIETLNIILYWPSLYVVAVWVTDMRDLWAVQQAAFSSARYSLTINNEFAGDFWNRWPPPPVPLMATGDSVCDY